MKRKKKVPAPCPASQFGAVATIATLSIKKRWLWWQPPFITFENWPFRNLLFTFLPSLKFCIPFHDWLFFVDNSSLESSLLLFFSLVFYFLSVHKWPQIFGLLSFSEVMYTMYLSAFLPQLQYRQIFLFILYYIHRVKNWKCSPIKKKKTI